MTGIFSSAIAALCVSASGSYGPACNSAVDAGTRQIGFRQKYDLAENKATQIANNKSKDWIGDSGTYLFPTALVAYKGVRHQKIILKLPNMGICYKMTGEFNYTSYKIAMEWHF